jgi:hypothetical protein
MSCDERQKSRMDIVLCKELERVSVYKCLRVHACARVLECACMSASSPHRAYSRCCRSRTSTSYVVHAVRDRRFLK